MSREVEIEDLARTLGVLQYKDFTYVDDEAEYLIDDCGYRQADIVRKETAKEILQEIWNTGGTILSIQQLAKKYGVEIN